MLKEGYINVAIHTMAKAKGVNISQDNQARLASKKKKVVEEGKRGVGLKARHAWHESRFECLGGAKP